MLKKKCKNCSKKFMSIFLWQKFCSDDCRINNWKDAHKKRWQKYMRRYMRDYRFSHRDFHPNNQDWEDLLDFYDEDP